MEQIFYRVLKPLDEPKGEVLTTNRQSEFRKEVLAYWNLSQDIFNLAQNTGLLILNAVRIAENVPAYWEDDLKVFLLSMQSDYDLRKMLISDPIKTIHRNDLMEFAVNYISHMNETGLYYDWGQNTYIWEYIWEMVRISDYSDKPSRIESQFFFDNIDNAKIFNSQIHGNDYQLARIHLLEGDFQSFDMSWFSDIPSDITISEAEVYARNYWEQKQTDHPVMEFLFQGKYRWNDV